jgi:hypothetical protein
MKLGEQPAGNSARVWLPGGSENAGGSCLGKGAAPQLPFFSPPPPPAAPPLRFRWGGSRDGLRAGKPLLIDSSGMSAVCQTLLGANPCAANVFGQRFFSLRLVRVYVDLDIARKGVRQFFWCPKLLHDVDGGADSGDLACNL